MGDGRVRVVLLETEHASAAAAIHAEGQPGTFLTGLGRAFLRALYAEMAASPHCLGYVATLPRAAGDAEEVVGVTVGTVDSGAVFKDLLLRRGLRLAIPILSSLVRQPRLIPKVFQTFFYTGQTGRARTPGEAELLFIGTRGSYRGKGVGRALFRMLAEALRQRGVTAMGLSVDDANPVAKRFYERNGMRPIHTFTLYGRLMHWYSLPLTPSRRTDENDEV